MLGYGAALVWGLAAGLLGYRFGVLPLHLESSGPELLGIVGIGLGLVALPLHWRWRRNRPRDRAMLGRLAVACGAAALVGSAALQGFPPLSRLRLATERLPGFSIDIPQTGDPITGKPSDYRTGQIVKQRLGGLLATVTVGWAAGDLPDDDHAEEMNDTIALAYRSRKHDLRPETGVALSEPLRARSWVANHDTVRVWMTFVACGGRRLSVITVSTDRGVEGLHRRMMATLHCRPDVAQESALRDIPVVFDVDGAWRRAPGAPDLLVLRQEVEDGYLLLAAQSVPGSVEGNLERMLLIGILGRIGPEVSIGYAEEDRWSVQGRLDDRTIHGWARLQACPDRGQSIAVIWIGWSEHDAHMGIMPLHRARCRRADEPRQRWAETGDR